MSETKVSEPKMVDGRRQRKVRRNRKDYGEIIYYQGKVAVYWTKRRTDQYHRAIRGWLIEGNVITAVRAYGVTHVGIRVEDGSLLLTPLTTFGASGIERGAHLSVSNTYVDQWGNRGAMCWHVPDNLWARKDPDEATKHEYMMGQMHIKRGRVRSSK